MVSENAYHKGTNYSCKIPKLPFKFEFYSSLWRLSGTATETCRTFNFVSCLLRFHTQYPVCNPPLSEGRAAVPGTLQNHTPFCQFPSNKGNILHCFFHNSVKPPPPSFLSVSKSSHPYRHTTDTGHIHFVTKSYKTRTSKSCRLRTLSYLNKVYNKWFTLQSFPQEVHFIACLWMYFQGKVKQIRNQLELNFHPCFSGWLTSTPLPSCTTVLVRERCWVYRAIWLRTVGNSCSCS
jgi:hypothetical protein